MPNAIGLIDESLRAAGATEGNTFTLPKEFETVYINKSGNKAIKKEPYSRDFLSQLLTTLFKGKIFNPDVHQIKLQKSKESNYRLEMSTRKKLENLETQYKSGEINNDEYILSKHKLEASLNTVLKKRVTLE